MLFRVPVVLYPPLECVALAGGLARKRIMITANEARLLSGETPEEKVEAIQPLIEEAAKKGRRAIIIRDSNVGGGMWVNGGYNSTDEWKECVEILRGLGYAVRFYYEERQFVDMGTEISWEQQ